MQQLHITVHPQLYTINNLQAYGALGIIINSLPLPQPHHRKLSLG